MELGSVDCGEVGFDFDGGITNVFQIDFEEEFHINIEVKPQVKVCSSSLLQLLGLIKCVLCQHVVDLHYY